MGCWNGTCGISGLPIEYGDKVKAVILKRVGNVSKTGPGANSPIGQTSPADEWKPIMVPLEGVYNDYGSIEDIKTSYAGTLFLNHVNELLKSDQLNVVHDQYTKEITEFKNLELLFNCIERGRVSLGKYQLAFMLAHKSIWDTALKATAESRDSYRKSLKGSLDLAVSISIVETFSEFSFMLMDKLKSQLRNEWGWALNDYRLSPEVKEMFLDPMFTPALVKDKVDIDFVKNTQDQVIEFLQIRIAMERLRRGWYPALCGAGSQDSSWEAHNVLAKGIQKLASRKAKEEESYESD